jgi:hypothetical protein
VAQQIFLDEAAHPEDLMGFLWTVHGNDDAARAVLHEWARRKGFEIPVTKMAGAEVDGAAVLERAAASLPGTRARALTTYVRALAKACAGFGADASDSNDELDHRMLVLTTARLFLISLAVVTEAAPASWFDPFFAGMTAWITTFTAFAWVEDPDSKFDDDERPTEDRVMCTVCDGTGNRSRVAFTQYAF